MSYQFGQIDPDERVELGDDDREAAAPPPRRRGLTATVLTVLVMAMFSGGLWFAYVEGTRHATRQEGGGGIPLIRADEHPTKVKPEQPGGMAIPDQDKTIFSEKPGGPTAERLLPQPEPLLPRPTAPEAAAQAAAAPAAAPPQPVQAPPSAPADNAAPAIPPVRPVATAAAPSLKPAPAHAPPAVKGGRIRIQIGAMRSEELAHHEWDRLKRANSDVLRNLSAVAVRADLGAKGVFYRIQAGPIADMAAAERICGELKQRKLGCIIVR